MGRRIRHFNPAHHDAIKGGTCIDARFIPGLADGAAVQTWTSRAGGSHTYTQSTSERRPLFTLRSQGGQAAVTFTAANQHWMSRSGIAVASAAVPYAIIAASSMEAAQVAYSQTASTTFLGASLSGNWTMLFRAGVTLTIHTTASAQIDTIASEGGNTGVLASGRSGSTTMFNQTALTIPPTLTTQANLDLSTTRTGTAPSSYSNTIISGLCIAVSALTDSMRHRIMQHYGYSFKRAL